MCGPASLLIIISAQVMAVMGTFSPKLLSEKASIRIPTLPAISISLSFIAAITDEMAGMPGKSACDIALASLSLMMLQRHLPHNYFIAQIALNILSLAANLAAALSGDKAIVCGVFCTTAVIYTLLFPTTVVLKNWRTEVPGVTETVSDLIYLVLTFVVLILSLTTSAMQDLQPAFEISLTGFSCTTFVLNLTRFTRGQSFALLGHLERELTDSGCKQLSERRLSYEEKNKVYAMIFKRIQRYLDDDMPYLDDEFSLSKMAEDIFTNKHYVSRAISEYSGMNFCQFINTYRIRYSIECIKHNPNLKVAELAVMCGFKTLSSYNQAFRKYTGETPSDWVRRNFRKVGSTEKAVLQN